MGGNPVILTDPTGYTTITDEDTSLVLDVILDGLTDILSISTNGIDGGFERVQGPAELIGETLFEDTFIKPCGENKGKPIGYVCFDRSINDYMIEKEMLARKYAYWLVAYMWWQSTSKGSLDIKRDPRLGGMYAGNFYKGKCITLREAGNILAGINSAYLEMDWEDFQKGAGALHIGGDSGIFWY